MTSAPTTEPGAASPAAAAATGEPVAVIVAHADDVHARAVQAAVARRGGRGHILDVQDFTISYDLVTAIGADGVRLEVRHRGGPAGAGPVIGAVSGLWWRRVAYPAVGHPAPPAPRGVRSIVEGERRDALIGSLEGTVVNAFNDPGCSRRAAHKPAQLIRARELGLPVPETLITNDPAAVREFHERVGGTTVYKMFRGAPAGLFGTRRLGPDELDALDRLTSCPAIFQEYVDGEFDVRAVVVGDQVFAARLGFAPLDEIVDTRFVPTTIEPLALPSEVADRLVALVRGFGLVYSAVDLRYSPSRGFVFFESNPEGQYLWIEIEADLAISDAIAARLLPDPADG